MKHIVILDLETTGLDPRRDLILECAALLVNTERLSIESIFGALVSHKADVLNVFIESADARWAEMHTKSGLIAALRDGKQPRVYGHKELDETLYEWATQRGFEPCSVRLGGFSSHFDREFLIARCPLFSSFLHHRVVNVSTLRDLAKEWCDDEGLVKADGHRALTDAHAALQSLRYYRERYFK